MLPSPSEIGSHSECETQEEVLLESSIDSEYSIEITVTDNEEENHHMPQEMQENSTEESQKNETNSCEGSGFEIPTEVRQEIPAEDDPLYNYPNGVSEEYWFLNLSENVSDATSQATSDNFPPQAETYIEVMSQHLPPLISPIPEPEGEVEERAGPSRFSSSFDIDNNNYYCQVGVKRQRVDDRLDAIEHTLKQHTNEFYQLHQSLERLKEYFEEQEPEDYFGRFVGTFIFGTPGLYGRTRLVNAIMQLIADEIQREETETSNSEL